MRMSILGGAVVLAAATLPALAQTAQTQTAQTQTLQLQTAQILGTTPGPASDTGARPGNEIGTGNSLPRSNNSSNINAADSKSEIAPNLPSPPLGENSSPRDYLIAARNSLAAGKTGMAQQSLEMAQTRLLDRSVNRSQVNDASRDPRVKRIEDARQALGNGNSALAMQIIESALAP